MKIRRARPSQIPESWKNRVLGLDIETKDDDLDTDICIISLYNPEEDVSLVIPLDYYQKGKRILETEEEIQILKETLRWTKAVGHYLTFDLTRILRKWGVRVRIEFDTFILARVLQLDTNALKDIYLRIHPERAHMISKFSDLLGDKPPFYYNFDTPGILQYSGLDSVLPFRIMEHFKKTIEKKSIQSALRTDFGYLQIAIDQMAKGIDVNMDKYYSLRPVWEEEYFNRVSDFSSRVGVNFRPNSSADIEKVLWEGMGIPSPFKTKKGKMSWGTESLEYLLKSNSVDDMQGKVVQEIIDLKSRFAVNNNTKKIPEYVKDGKMFYTVEPIGYDGTSRVYTSNPSVQQLPKPFRECIEPTKGKKFLYLDWSGAELYILAYWAKIELLLEAFHNNEDVHSKVMRLMMGRDELEEGERDRAKILSYSIVFGSDGSAAAREIGIPREEGVLLAQKYLETFPEIDILRNKIVSFARKTGYTKNLLGRVRRLPNINSEVPQERESSERQAFNTAIQGTCADLFKTTLARNKYSWEEGVEFVIGVFDSFLFEVPMDFTEEQAEEMMERLSSFEYLFEGFRFRYKWAFGSNWKECADKT